MAATKKSKGVTSEAAARAALTEMRSLKSEAERLMEEHGIKEKLEKADALKKAVTTWAVENEMDVINLGTGVYYRLRRDKYGGQWVATDDDVNVDTPPAVVPLKTILKKKFPDKDRFTEVWYKVTRRSVDPEKLERAILQGDLTHEEVAPAFYEKEKSPFLMGYGG